MQQDRRLRCDELHFDFRNFVSFIRGSRALRSSASDAAKDALDA